MSERAPYRRWRVAVEGKEGTAFRGQTAAYRYVGRIVTRSGEAIVVHHWENGQWRLFERFPGAVMPP